MKLIFALALASASLVRAADPTPLDLKVGEWEYSVTMKMAGMPQMPQQMPQIPPDQLAKLPPEQRAKIEAMMKNAGNLGSGKPSVNRRCLKKEDLANFNPTSMSKTCKTTITSSSGSRFEAKVECNDPDNKTTSTIVAEALSAESMKFTMVSSGTANGHPMNMTINGAGKWLTAACSDTK
ncbi:MAG: DUF3617 domain-containing protein [Bryobacteraceae bacterium]|jgi:hypothetical protein